MESQDSYKNNFLLEKSCMYKAVLCNLAIPTFCIFKTNSESSYQRLFSLAIQGVCSLITASDMAGAVSKVGNYVKNGLEKIQSKSWAEPLGKGLAVGAKISSGLETFVPGAGILGGALAFGASLLNPEPTVEDLQKDLQDIKLMLQDQTKSRAAVRALQREQVDLEERIAKPVGEIKENLKQVQLEMRTLCICVEKNNRKISDDLSKLRDIINQTYLLVADVRYRVSFYIVILSITSF